MIIYSYPKINLGLSVLPKIKGEKLHKLKTIMIEVKGDLYDIVSININNTNKDRFYNTKKIGYPNTISNTIDILRDHYKIKCFFDISIIKNIPMGAGLGGGSANAVTTARIITKLLDIPWEKEELKKLLLTIGSDVPFFVEGGTCYVGMYGEFVQPIKLKFPAIKFIKQEKQADPNYLNVLLRPKKHFSTKKIFEIYDLLPLSSYDFRQPYHKFENKDITFMKLLFNDLEIAVNKIYKPIHRKNTKYRYLLIGSGSSYLLFNTAKINFIF